MWGIIPKLVLGTALIATVVGLNANASPFRLEYALTDLGSSYQYDFKLTLDNNDSSWLPGQGFDTFIIGDAKDAPSAFTEGALFFKSVPSGFFPISASGTHNGPTLCFAPNCGSPLYVPTSIGETLIFSGISKALLGDGALLWSTLQFSSGAKGANFQAAYLTVAQTPLPAAFVLFGSGIGFLGFFGWLRKRFMRPDHDGNLLPVPE